MMTKSEVLIRTILGKVQYDIRPFIYSLDVACELLAVSENMWDEICVTRDIYRVAARRLGKKTETVARSAERLANLCWDSMDQQMVLKYIGEPIRDINAPSELIFYLAFYIRHGKPYYKVVRERFELFFVREHAEAR